MEVNLVFPSSIGGIGPLLRMLMDTIATAIRIYQIRDVASGMPDAHRDTDTHILHEAQGTRVRGRSVDESP